MCSTFLASLLNICIFPAFKIYHLLGFENGINKRHVLDVRPNSVSGWRAGHWFTALFPNFLLFFPSSLQTHVLLLPFALKGKAVLVWGKSGRSLHSPLERPWRVMGYMQTMNSLQSFFEHVFSICWKASVFHPFSVESSLIPLQVLLKSVDLLVEWGAVVWCV